MAKDHHSVFVMCRGSKSPLWTAVSVIRRVLFHILALLQEHRTLGADVSFPGRGANVLWPGRIGEEFLDLFERLSRRLGEHEEDMDEHGGTEDTEDHVCPPLDVDKCRWHKVAEREVERPIRGRGERHRLATNSERV